LAFFDLHHIKIVGEISLKMYDDEYASNPLATLLK